MHEQPAAVAPVPAPPAPSWGLGAAAGALAVILLVTLIGASVVVHVFDAAVRHNAFAEAVIGEQALVAGILLAMVTIVLPKTGFDLSSLGYRFPGARTMALSVSMVVPIYVAAALVQALFDALLPSYRLSGNAARTFTGVPLHPPLWAVLVLLLFISVEIPLIEETVFRVILFGGLRNTLARRLPRQAAVFLAAIVSGALFALAHQEPHTLPILMMIGVALAYVYHTSRSVYASAAVHAVINALGAIAYLQPS